MSTSKTQHASALGGAQSWAYALNEKGQVVGSAEDSAGVSRAFVGKIDGSGLLVGSGDTDRNVGVDSTAGFIAGNGMGMRNLDDFVTLPNSLKVSGAKAINSRGQILVNGDSDESPLYILTPTRPTWKEELEAD